MKDDYPFALVPVFYMVVLLTAYSFFIIGFSYVIVAILHAIGC